MAELIGMSTDVKGKRFLLSEDTPLSIGRTADNAIQIDTPSISGHHCRIYFQNGSFFLEDLQSTNGTRLNGIKVDQKPAPIKNRNLIQVGAVEFIVEDPLSVLDAPSASNFETDVEISTDAAAAPGSFTNISPVNARSRESRGLLFILLILASLFAIAGIGFLPGSCSTSNRCN